MNMVHSASDNCIRCVRSTVAEMESVTNRQKFHILGKCPPRTCVVLSAAHAVGMDLTRLENHCLISSDVLGLLLYCTAIG